MDYEMEMYKQRSEMIYEASQFILRAGMPDLDRIYEMIHTGVNEQFSQTTAVARPLGKA